MQLCPPVLGLLGWLSFFLILITIFSVRKLTTEKDYFICISSPVFAIQNVTLRSMLLDDIYPAPKIAGQLYSGSCPRACVDCSSKKGVPDMPGTCLLCMGHWWQGLGSGLCCSLMCSLAINSYNGRCSGWGSWSSPGLGLGLGLEVQVSKESWSPRCLPGIVSATGCKV